MNDIQKAWIAALRSGKYRQARGYLRCGRRELRCYCATGVLCALYAQKKKKKFESVLKGNTHMVPPWITKWAGLNQAHIDAAIADNDENRMSFAQIADKLERVL